MNIIEVVISAIDETKEGMDSAAEGGSKAGKAISAGMVAAAAAIAGVGIAAAALSDQIFKAMDIEAANDKLAAQLGLTAQQSEAYGRTAGSLYSQAYGDSLDDVNEALRYVTQNIGDLMGNSEGALEGVTARAMDLAATFDVDVAESTRAVGVLLKNGLAKDAEEAFDIITVGFQNGANAGDDLTDTINEYSPLFNKLGLSGAQAMGMISQSMKAGARDSDFAADAIKEFSIRAIDGSKTTVEAFQALGMNADKMRATFAKGGPESAAALDQVMDKLRGMKDPAAQAEVAVKLFGTKAEDLRHTLLAMDPSAAVGALGEVEGAAARMSATLADNAKTKLESFKRTIETNVSNFIGQEVLPKVVALAEQAAPKLTEFAGKAQEAFNWAKDKPEVLGAVAAVVGVVLVAAFIALAAAAWSAAAGVIAATWPVLAIAAAVAGLVAILVAAYNNWDTFRDAVNKAGAIIQEYGVKAFEMLKTAAIALYENALAPMIGYIQDNSEKFANLGKILLIVAGIIVGVVLAALAAVVVAILVVVAVLAVLVTAIGVVIAWLLDFVDTLWNWFNNARDVCGGIVDNIENVIQIFWDLMNNAGTAIANVIRAIWNCIQVVWDMVQNVGNAIDRVRSFFMELPGKILSAVGDLGSLLLGAGRAILDGLVRGFENGLSWAKGKIGDGLKSIRNLFPFSPAKEGPFSGQGYTDVSGAALMQDFAKGVAGQATSAARTVANALEATASPFDLSGANVRASAAAAQAYAAGPVGGFGAGSTVTFTGNTSDALATVIMGLVRQGKIQIQPSMAVP